MTLYCTVPVSRLRSVLRHGLRYGVPLYSSRALARAGRGEVTLLCNLAVFAGRLWSFYSKELDDELKRTNIPGDKIRVLTDSGRMRIADYLEEHLPSGG